MRSSALIVALMAAMACLMAPGGVAADDTGERLSGVVRVGGESLTGQDVATRQRLNDARPGMGGRVETALYQLVKAACLRDVAQRMGRPLAPKDLEREVQRIDENTRMPEHLATLKALCADEAAYARVFVLPDFSERWLHAQYPWHPELHGEEGRHAESILADALASESGWAALAQRENLECRKILVSREQGIRPVAEDEEKPGDEPGGRVIDASKAQPPAAVMDAAKSQMDAKEQVVVDQMIEKVLAPLQPGAIHGHVIQMEREFLVLRLVEVKDDEYTAETIAVPKTGYEVWVKAQIAGTSILVADQAAWNAMLAAVPATAELFAGARFAEASPATGK